MICYQSNGCMLWLEGLGDNENRPEVFNFAMLSIAQSV